MKGDAQRDVACLGGGGLGGGGLQQSKQRFSEAADCSKAGNTSKMKTTCGLTQDDTLATDCHN